MSDTLSIDAAYREGYKAYQNDQPRADNPYDNNEQDALRESWNRGFEEAAFDD